MRKVSVAVMVLGLIAIPSISMADYGCTRKLAKLEEQLSYAKKYNNSYRVRGLERAISNVKTYCGGGYPFDSMEAKSHYQTDQRLEVLDKIADANKDLSKAQYKLDKARRKGDIEDQYEAEHKIKEAQKRVELYESYLEELK